jgi:septal ring factor EnvC (AmiA/AmiB activator)
MCEEYSQLGDGMEVDSGPLRTSQSSEMPEGKGSEQFPPYVKAMMKKLESMSYAIQQQTKTNSKLADNLGMLVEKFARMEERMNAVQAENVNLLEILDGMQEKIKALENKPATNIPVPRQTTYASVVNSGLPPCPVHR